MAAQADGTAPIPADPDELVRRIADRQQHLATTVDELKVRMSPKDIARRSKEGAEAKVRAATTAEDGSVRVERVGAAGAAALALVVLVVWRKVRKRRRRGVRRKH